MLREWGFIFCSLLHIPAACWTLKNPLLISVLFLFHLLKIVTLISWLPMSNLRLTASGHFKHSDLQWLFICPATLCWRVQWQCSFVVLGFIVNLHINSILRAIDASGDMVSIVIHERFPEHTVSIPIPQLSDSHWLSYRPCNIAGSKQLIPHKIITVCVSGRKGRVSACWNGFRMDV